MTRRLFGDAPGTTTVIGTDGHVVLHDGVFGNEETDDLFDALMSEIPWEQHQIQIFGRIVDEPRLAAWIGDPHATYTYSRLTLEPHAWTPTTRHIADVCAELAGSSFNSVLANLYRTGRDSMGWHADDEPELGSEPVIASVTFGGVRRFDLRHRTTGDTISTHPPSGSILVMAGATQRHWRHQVPKTARPVEPRINLTYRLIT